MPKDFKKFSDFELWQAFKEGDEEAFAFIYNKFFPDLSNYGRQIVKDSQLIEDCVHDIFVYIHSHQNTLSNIESIKYYLFRAIRRKIIESLELQKKNKQDFSSEHSYNFEAILSPEQQLILAQHNLIQHNELIKSINLLPERQREVIYLFYFINLKYKEIASIMGLEIRTVYNHIFKALETLKKHMPKTFLI